MDTRSRRFAAPVATVLALLLSVADSATMSVNAAPRVEGRGTTREQHSDAHQLAERPAAAQPPTSEDLSALGLGTRRMASELLRKRPGKALREAAHGDGGEKLLWPLDQGHFVRGFGYVRKVRKDLPHLGVDIAAKTGTPIHAAADGIVAYADDGVKGYGNLAILVHADGSVTSYAHCDRLLVTPGTRVTRGETIATVGSTGISQGPHLHFELRTDGKPRNPLPRFDRSLSKTSAPILLSAL